MSDPKAQAYTLRDIDPALWKRAKVRAAQDGLSLRAVILQLLDHYGQGAPLASTTPQEGTPQP